MKDDINKLKQDKKTLEADLATALNALRFYGNRCNWVVSKRINEIKHETYFSSDIAEDDGQKGRITVDAILKVRKHKKQVEESRYSYNDMQLDIMGYQIIPFGDGGFVIVLKPEEALGLFKFAGIGLDFTIDMTSLKSFHKMSLARIAISNYINKQALMIKHKPKGE